MRRTHPPTRLLALLAGLIALSVTACSGSAATSASGPTPSAALPLGGKVVATIPISPGWGSLAAGEGAVWAMSDADSTLTRIDPVGNTAVARIKVEPGGAQDLNGVGDVEAGDGAVWVSHPSVNTVSRIDPQTNSVIATIPIGPQPSGIATTPGAVWVADSGGPSVSRIDPATNQVVATIRVGPAGACCSFHMGVTAGGGAIWVAVPNLNAVVRIDPATNAVIATIPVLVQLCGFLAADVTAVWAAGDNCYGDVARLDPRTNKPTGWVNGEVDPIGLALGFGSLWVADRAGMIARVNPGTSRIIARLAVGGYPINLAVGFGSVWVRDDTGHVLRITPG